MTREIKFRAWHIANKEMVYFDLKCPYQVQHMAALMGDFHHEPGVLMQYTGLQGLYEGDIIEDNNGIGIIEYHEKFAAFRVRYANSSNRKWFYDYLYSEWESVVKLGNIHENPELLEDAK